MSMVRFPSPAPVFQILRGQPAAIAVPAILSTHHLLYVEPTQRLPISSSIALRGDLVAPFGAELEVVHMKIDGACHCGLITYEAEIDPEKVRVCHCTDCQSLTGSAFRVVVPVPADKFSLSGEPTVYVKTAESGARRAQAFCTRFGSGI